MIREQTLCGAHSFRLVEFCLSDSRSTSMNAPWGLGKRSNLAYYLRGRPTCRLHGSGWELVLLSSSPSFLTVTPIVPRCLWANTLWTGWLTKINIPNIMTPNGFCKCSYNLPSLHLSIFIHLLRPNLKALVNSRWLDYSLPHSANWSFDCCSLVICL